MRASGCGLPPSTRVSECGFLPSAQSGCESCPSPGFLESDPEHWRIPGSVFGHQGIPGVGFDHRHISGADFDHRRIPGSASGHLGPIFAPEWTKAEPGIPRRPKREPAFRGTTDAQTKARAKQQKRESELSQTVKAWIRATANGRSTSPRSRGTTDARTKPLQNNRARVRAPPRAPPRGPSPILSPSPSPNPSPNPSPTLSSSFSKQPENGFEPSKRCHPNPGFARRQPRRSTYAVSARMGITYTPSGVLRA